MNTEIQEKLIKACRFIEAADAVPTLAAVSAHVYLSPAYFQKTFSKVLGISPRHYADALRFKRLREYLQKGNDISRALYDAGFGASSRLYEFANQYLGMTPKSYQDKGKGNSISYTIVDTELGFLLVAATTLTFTSIVLVPLSDPGRNVVARLFCNWVS